jgi:hypothetical protein
MRDVAEALDSKPLALIGLASALMSVFDEQTPAPFVPGEEKPVVGRAEFVQTLIEVPSGETSGLLAAIAGLTEDGVPNQLLVKDLLAHFGVTGSVSQRAKVFLAAAGYASDFYSEIDLGAPDLLVAARRRHILELRDQLAADY